jgi:putative transposase
MATADVPGASDHGEPFKWSKSADQILTLVKRFCQKTQNTLCSKL